MKKILIIATVIIGVISFFYIIGSFSTKEVFEPFLNASWWAITGFILVSFLISVSLTKRWEVINKTVGIKIPFWQLYLYRLAGYCISYVTPGPRVGGEPVVAGLLKKRGINYMQSLSAMVVDKTLDGSVSAVVFIIGTIAAISWFALPQNITLVLIISAVFFAALIAYFYYRMLKGKDFIALLIRFLRLDKIKKIKKYEQKIVSFEKLIIRFYKKEKKAFIIATLLCVVNIVLMFFEYTFVLAILGEKTSAIGIFFIVAFIGAALLFPIPAAIGSLEAGQVSAAAINSMKSSIGFSLSLIIRVRDIIWVIIGFLILFYFGFDIKNYFKKFFRKYIKINKNIKVYLRD